MGLISRLLGLGRPGAPTQRREFQVLEADSPAIGANGSLVEHVGISIYDGTVVPLIECGASIPVEVSDTFSTMEDNQDQITLFFYRGNAAATVDNTFLGEVRLTGFRLAKAREPRVRLFVRANGGNLELAASDDQSGEPIRLTRVRASDHTLLH